MQEIFSKQIMNSDKYSTAGSKDNFVDRGTVNFTKNGDYLVVAKGTFTLHGVTKDLQTQCLIKVKGNTVQATTEFHVNMKDFKIENPIDNDSIKIMIDCLLESH
jgi:polyisoprenoid-binding protein YceI